LTWDQGDPGLGPGKDQLWLEGPEALYRPRQGCGAAFNGSLTDPLK